MKVPFFKYILIVGVIIYATAALAIPELDVDIQDLQERSEAMKEADIENPIGIDHKLKPRANTGGANQPLRVPVTQLNPNGGGLPIDITGLGPQVAGGDVQGLRLAALGGGAGGGAGRGVVGGAGRGVVGGAGRGRGNNGRGKNNNGRGNNGGRRRPRPPAV
ncbi:hypothetical protein CH35J_009637 [Colletotrichum higginsianum]|uniref:Uncharacterized protein n=1 Tax=Colletotrichum higginsianum TaxID=80884 RepID=A0A4T0VMI7_9PEZI|nr:hypothetical protein CH35J_009637 [Colletotrichum higginsianum]